jgi:hypothetical protein
VPSGAAWWISRLERYNCLGLRGNWLSSWALHDYMASLLGKPNAGTSAYSPTAGGYWLNGEWQVYHYYHANMTGYRVSTTGSSDGIMDAYATVSASTVHVLIGAPEDWHLEPDDSQPTGCLPTRDRVHHRPDLGLSRHGCPFR